MPRSVLSISSQVAFGPVGNSATVPALESLGLTVYPVPTIVLAHHPGHGKPAGFCVPAAELAAMLDALLQVGALHGLAAVFTGYFAADDQILAVARMIERLKRNDATLLYLCDPVIGSETTGLYVPLPVAEAVKTSLLPLADVLTPNSFELEWLSGIRPRSVGDVRAACSRLGIGSLIAKSMPSGDAKLLTVLTGALGEGAFESDRRAAVPNGTGDLLAGLFLGHLLSGIDARVSLGRSLSVIETVIAASAGTSVLDLSVLPKVQPR